MTVHLHARTGSGTGEPLLWAICSDDLGPLDYYSTRSAAEYALERENYNPRITVRRVLPNGQIDER